MLFKFGLFLTALLILIILLVIITIVYDWLTKLFVGKPEISIIKHQYKPHGKIAQPVVKKVLYQRFEVDNKNSKVLHDLTRENFKELLSPYFIAINYLQELWIQHPFNIVITNELQLHYGKDISLNGFIRNNDIPDIYIKFKTTRKHRTGVLLHELAHHRANTEAKNRNVRITSHGPEFKRHMKLLFKPLLVDRTYYKKNEELSYHLRYGPNRYTPTKDLCV